MANLRIFSRVEPIASQTLLHIRKKHAYKTASLTLSQLEENLLKYAVYDEGLLILNKPVGISFEKGPVDADSLNPARDVCIKSALPCIKNHFKINELYNVKIPERNISGVTIFSDNENLALEVKKWWRILREKQEEMDTYLCVVIGEPLKSSGQFSGGISLQVKNSIKRMVLSETVGKNAVKRGEVKRVVFSYRTLASNGAASLVEVKTSRSKWNSVRVFLACHTLTPILGDWLFGMYVKQLLGSPVPEDVFGKPQLPQIKLPDNLRKQLNLSGHRDLTVPFHLHLSSVRLMKKRKQVLDYSMPPPELFKWTLDQLGLTSQTLEASSLSN